MCVIASINYVTAPHVLICSVVFDPEAIEVMVDGCAASQPPSLADRIIPRVFSSILRVNEWRGRSTPSDLFPPFLSFPTILYPWADPGWT